MDANYLGHDIPKLGFGFMRLPKIDGHYDMEQVKAMVDLYLARGFRYFDTAYVYDDGASERAIKEAIVDRYPRESFLLATKLPARMQAQSAQEVQELFYTSLERTGAGYFDFYLLHSMGKERTAFFEKFGIFDFLLERKRQGQIRHLGFSIHDSAENLDKILTAHPELEFVQLQINYADWESPTIQSRLCYETALRHNKPVIIMEPVKGGHLASPPAQVTELMESVTPGMSPASWAVRYAASLPGVITVLSGMSTLEQVRDNVSYMSDFKPLSEAEQAVLVQAREVFAHMPTIPCTSCDYCAKGCPQNVAISGAFESYNLYKTYGSLDSARVSYGWNTEGEGKASACIGCGACEAVCPQSLPIIENLKKVAALFE
ncbi:MAG: aldo/keto reductase [Oscillospiraceae bacterium]